MLTFEKNLIIVALVIRIVIGNFINDQVLFEGNNCQLQDGKEGVCTLLPECKSIYNNFNTYDKSKLVTCSYKGIVPITCCPDRTPNVKSSTETRIEPGFHNGLIFEPTTSSSIVNWNQKTNRDFRDNNRESLINGNSHHGIEEVNQLNGNELEEKESKGTGIIDPWKPFNFRPSATTVPTVSFNEVHSNFNDGGSANWNREQSDSFTSDGQNKNAKIRLPSGSTLGNLVTANSHNIHDKKSSNSNFEPWMIESTDLDKNQQNSVGSDVWHWKKSTTTSTTERSFLNEWSGSTHNNLNHGESSLNFNNANFPFNTNTNTVTSTAYASNLDPWMIDALNASTSVSTKEANSNMAVSVRKALRACERYSKLYTPRLDFHIIDGKPTIPGEFPHMAGLGYREFETEDYAWNCGGSLISERYVLTAAHCCEAREPKLVRLGKTTVRNNDDGAEAVDVGISKIMLHPKYQRSSKYYDIALIQLENDVQFINDVAPACLYTNMEEIDPNINVIATGWGTDDVQKRTTSNFLLKVNLTTSPLNNCNQSHFDYGSGFPRTYSSGLNLGQMCAYDPEYNKDSCQGDSGGPLQIVNQSVHLSTLVGVTSFGVGCASATPSVYTRVAFFLDWIASIVWP